MNWQKLLGDDADELLNYQCKGVPREDCPTTGLALTYRTVT
jgi:hypothetical protein